MSVLQRKAQAGKQEHQARAMSVPKALRVSIAKVADEVFDMALAVIGATQEKCGGDTLEGKVDEGALLVLLDGPAGCAGGAMIGSELVGALIQQQTMGKITSAGPTERELTATDAALCAPLLDAMFQRAHGLVETDTDRDILCPYKFGARVENKRLFALALEETEYHLLKLTIDVAGGLCQSGLTLLLPVLEKGTGLISPDQEVAEKPPETLEKSVMKIRADLTAVLGRLSIPLSELSRLSPGDMLSLSPDAFDSVEIITRDRRIISRGAMGQLDGKRAVQLESADAGAQSSTGQPKEGLQMQMSQIPHRNSAATGEAHNALPHIDLGGIEHETATDLDLPDLPDLPSLEGVDDLPDLPSLDGDDGLPDLPDLPDLADLPDLPDLPDFDSEEELPALGDVPDFKIA